MRRWSRRKRQESKHQGKHKTRMTNEAEKQPAYFLVHPNVNTKIQYGVGEGARRTAVN